MITLNDVERIEIDSNCFTGSPCTHKSTVTLKDGRSVSRLTSFEIWAIISKLADERINDGKNAANAREHFKTYSQPRVISIPGIADYVWKVESTEVVLNRIFNKK